MAKAPIQIKNLSVAYQQKPVLNQLNYVSPEGECIGIIGPNGAGKSTLLQSIMGLLPLMTGSVQIYGKPIYKQRHKVSYVPQRESVNWDFPTNVLDVVLMGRYGKLGWFRRPSRSDREFAMDCLAKVGMADLADRQICQLSGGQQQRVFLARALVQEAEIYLLDEPFTGVDAATEKATIEILQKLKQQQKTVFVVHHDLQTVEEYFDSLLLLNQRLIAAGPTKEVFQIDLLQKTYGGKLTILSPKTNVFVER